MDEDCRRPLLPTNKKSPPFSACQIISLILLSVVVLFSVFFMAGGSQLLFRWALRKEMAVVPGTMSFKIWKKTPFPVALNIYIWNITNHEDFLEGAKPELQECGPYVWREYHEKKNVSFHNNSTVTYMQQRWWIWDEKLSGNNSRDDTIYTLNPVPVSSAWSVRDSILYMGMLNKIFNEQKESAIVKTTVNELLFTGFEDPVLDWVQKEVIAENGSYHPFLPFLNLPPGISEYDKFGWFYRRNMTLYYDGVFNMMTGEDDFSKIGKIDMWNYTRSTNFFKAPCNRINGSAGEFFQPGLARDKIQFYTSDLCMSMSLYYQKDVEVDGVKAYRFWGSNHTFANASTIPGNECFCVNGVCAPMGLLNAESCRMGAPAFVSFPHYFNADPFLLDQVEGLSPSEDKHTFVMDIMPETGVPVNVKARIQINLKVTPYPGHGAVHLRKIDILRSVPDIYLPMLWFEEFAVVPDDMSKRLKHLQTALGSPILYICFSSFVLVSIMLMTCIVYYSYKVKCRQEEISDDRFPESIYGSTSSSSGQSLKAAS